MSAESSNSSIYAGRAMAGPMVRVSCLGFRVLCAKQGADAVFSEELVSFKLKRCVREVVTYPVPLSMLPVGYQLRLEDIENAINGSNVTAQVRITTIYKPSAEEEQMIIGDATCNPSNLRSCILADPRRSKAALAELRAHFHEKYVIGEDFTSFLASSQSAFLSSGEIVAHLPVVEIIQYEAFKKGFRRALAASFLLKTSENFFPEGDRRPLQEREQAATNSDLRCVRVVAQIGTSNPQDAALGASIVADDVDGLDVNMGCPKAFSVQNGMGAALMKQPALAGSILRAIHNSVNSRTSLRLRSDKRHLADLIKAVVPISFKTRIFGSLAESVHHLATVVGNSLRHRNDKRGRAETDEFVALEVQEPLAAEVPCPLHGLSLHARTRDQRSETEPLRDEAAAIISALKGVVSLKVAVDEDGSETYTPSHSDMDEGDIHMAAHLRDMTFVFNGSLADNSRDRVPPPFQSALLARHCMWDMSVFSNYQYVTATTWASSGQQQLIPSRLPQHLPFHELLGWALPPPAGRSESDWLAVRAKITDAERYSVKQLAVVYLDLLRHFATYKNHSMYAKYHFTRSFGEFPVSKLTCHELEFLLSPAEVDVRSSAKVISGITGKVRGDTICFTTIQACSTWLDFYVALKRLELRQWGHCAPIESDEAILSALGHADQFMFAVTPRGDEIISTVPEPAAK